MSKNNERFLFDSDGFIERLNAVIGDESVKKFARQVGVSDSLIHNYRSGTIPSVAKASEICVASGIDDENDFVKYFGWLCLGLGDAPEFVSSRTPNSQRHSTNKLPLASDADDVVWIDSLDVFASAGNGFINDQELGNKLPFSHHWLAENGLLGKRLSLLRVSGDSMYPTLRDKETPLVEMLPDDIINRLADDIYVMRLNGQLLVKRIQRYGNNGFLIKSDNPHYESFQLTQENWPDDFKVIARWTGKKF